VRGDRLTPISYVVLGFIAQHGPSTPYEMERLLQTSIGYFWTFSHTQFYGEPAKLARRGLLTEEQEEGGRRRRVFSLTPAGLKALRGWLAAPTAERREIRDLAMLKLFFSELAKPEDVAALRDQQIAEHTSMVALFDEIDSSRGGITGGYRRYTLLMGRGVQQALVKFWKSVEVDPDVHRGRRTRK
jgi:DNA-binding PadR family transcriptional regulator